MNKTHILAAMVLVALVVVTGLAPSDGLAQQTPAAPKTGTPAPPAGSTMPAMPKVDINKASVEDLKKVPGLDESLAKKVVGGRPFKSVDELLSKKILSKDVFDKVKPLLVASQ
jgi:DNA uptake protein ComE-like DNA-binding protein